MMKSLEVAAFEAVPNETAFALLRDYWGAPIVERYLPLFLERISNEESEKMSRTLSWEHPLAREMDLNVHKRRLKGKNGVLLSIER